MWVKVEIENTLEAKLIYASIQENLHDAEIMETEQLQKLQRVSTLLKPIFNAKKSSLKNKLVSNISNVSLEDRLMLETLNKYSLT